MLNTVRWVPGVLHLAPTQAAALPAGGHSGCDSDDKTGEPPSQPDWGLLCPRLLRAEQEAPAAPAQRVNDLLSSGAPQHTPRRSTLTALCETARRFAADYYGRLASAWGRGLANYLGAGAGSVPPEGDLIYSSGEPSCLLECRSSAVVA